MLQSASNQGARRAHILAGIRSQGARLGNAHVERRITPGMDELCLDFESMSRMAMRSEAADSKMPTIESDSMFDELQH